MLTPELKEELGEIYPDLLFADGFEEAFLGVAEQFNRPMACYSYQKCIKILEKDMCYEDAVEYFSFNVSGAWVGEYTPVFLHETDVENVEKKE